MQRSLCTIWSSVLLGLSLILCGTWPGDAAASDTSSPKRQGLTRRIDEALKAGRMSLDDALVLKALVLKAPSLVPAEYQPEGIHKDGTLVVLDVLSHLEQATPQVRAFLQYMLAPPKDQARMTAPSLAGATLTYGNLATQALGFQADVVILSKESLYDTPEGHFTIHYYTSGKDKSSLADATRIGQYLETSLSHFQGIGYKNPAWNSQSRLDIYIKDLGTTYGWSYPDGLLWDAYIEIHNSFTWAQNEDPSGPLIGAQKATCAHELFHQVQFTNMSITHFEGWWLESSATHMEDEVFDEVNDYVNYLGPFFISTHVSLDDIGDGYETVLINKLLQQGVAGNDPHIIKAVMEGIGLLTSAEESMDAEMSRRGSSLVELIHRFALWNFFTGTRARPGEYYEEAAKFPDFNNFQQKLRLGPSKSSYEDQESDVAPLAAHYIQLRPEAGMTKARKLTIKVQREDTDGRGWVIVRRRSGDVETHELTWAGDEAKQEVTKFSETNIKEVVLVLTNGAITGTEDFSFTAKLDKPVDLAFVIDTTGSMWDDIFSVQYAADQILEEISKDDADFRVALVEFKDFPVWPYGDWGDYPYRAVHPFSDDKAAFKSALYGLWASGGHDWPESVYSGLMGTINTNGLTPWRPEAEKVILVMGDAPPHDPEPFTNYTLVSVVAAANALNSTPIAASPSAATSGHGARIFSVAIGGDPWAYWYYQQLSEQTGGKVFRAANSSQVVQAILAAIGAIGEEEDPAPPSNRPPDVTGAFPSLAKLWPVNHKMVDLQILNVTDPDGDDVSITITGITQDEPVSGAGRGSAPDGVIVGSSNFRLRAERTGSENGRIYRITFLADDGKGGQSHGQLRVCVPHDQGANTACADDGASYDSTQP